MAPQTRNRFRALERWRYHISVFSIVLRVLLGNWIKFSFAISWPWWLRSVGSLSRVCNFDDSVSACFGKMADPGAYQLTFFIWPRGTHSRYIVLTLASIFIQHHPILHSDLLWLRWILAAQIMAISCNASHADVKPELGPIYDCLTRGESFGLAVSALHLIQNLNTIK